MPIMYHYGFLLVLLDLSLDVVGSVSQLEINRHLELGREFLARGQLQDALTHYHAAVEGDANNYLTYYKRGTVYLALGKAKLALLDFDKVLELKPDFTAARLQRGNVLLKQADFDAAENDFHDVLSVDENNQEALNSLYTIATVKESLANAENLIYHEDHAAAIDLITQNVIQVCPWAAHLRELRAESYVKLENYLGAISDIRMTTKLLSDNTEGLYKLSLMLYKVGDVEESLTEIRKCLKLDPEHKKCSPFYRKLKKVNKCLKEAENAEELKDYDACIESAQRILTSESSVDNVRCNAFHLLCKCYVGNNKPEQAVTHCQSALDIRREPGLLCDSAEAYLAAELYDDAIREFKEALNIDPNFSRAKQGLQKAEQRQKLSESRDYYKILNVPRTATKREIIKAYRKAAQKWHPDNFQEGDEKKRAEKKFIDIAAAKEVLTDDEKRAKFDQGEDPLDPESGKNPHGFNGFREFHYPHGSPFQFKFHFN
ncbi:dnaJ homolog subfamily C member 3 [Prorops nasuta]|uniref:dnaJ homolog subfamily C member 3 n=1 Tax=Prorops nasuta TaxID=863751 RepID=UPI0034CEB7E1